jgi:two-component system chemotaxis response regulator CheB
MPVIKVLIVDDSTTAVRHLSQVLLQEPDFQVLGTAGNGLEGVALAASLRPDVVCMDINMPDIDGFETTRRIMSNTPVPIVIVSSVYEPRLVSMAFRGLEAGALAIIEKPPAGGESDQLRRQQAMRDVVRATARRRVPRSRPLAPVVAPVPAVLPATLPTVKVKNPEFLLVGASTGGPQSIHVLLSHLPKAFPLPILIVQHMSEGFSAGFAHWLNQSTGWHVAMAKHGDLPCSGRVYLAPEKIHMELAADRTIALLAGGQEHGVCPAVSRLFRSAIRCNGGQVLAVLLSGMGRDGAAELKQLRDAGALTIAQDASSSVVHGMPGAAIKLGGACLELTDRDIATALCRALRISEGTKGV